jgi:hypothetical protein
MTNTFISDLAFGKEYEKRALNYFSNYRDVEFSQGKNKLYDVSIVMNDHRRFIEVKSDRMGKRTGNVAIEYECNGKPSGITSTGSDYWVYFVEGVGVYKFPIADLREIFSRCWYKCIKGGDGFRSKMKLIPIADLKAFEVQC